MWTRDDATAALLRTRRPTHRPASSSHPSTLPHPTHVNSSPHISHLFTPVRAAAAPLQTMRGPPVTGPVVRHRVLRLVPKGGGGGGKGLQGGRRAEPAGRHAMKGQHQLKGQHRGRCGAGLNRRNRRSLHSQFMLPPLLPPPHCFVPPLTHLPPPLFSPSSASAQPLKPSPSTPTGPQPDDAGAARHRPASVNEGGCV